MDRFHVGVSIWFVLISMCVVFGIILYSRRWNVRTLKVCIKLKKAETLSGFSFFLRYRNGFNWTMMAFSSNITFFTPINFGK